MSIQLPTADNPVVLLQGDCLELLPQIPAGMVDAVVTDPPYGIGEARGKNKSRSCIATSKDYGDASWDDRPCPPEAIAHMRRVSRHQIIFGGNYFDLPPSSCWLVWDKLNGNTDFADCELAWTNLRQAVRRIHHRWHGMIREGNETRYHPTQKPLAVVVWCLSFLPERCTVLDPFAGSGTTALACLMTGRRCLSIELDPHYHAVAQKRIDDYLAAGPLFDATPQQAELFTA
jgi:DNA modification methylase